MKLRADLKNPNSHARSLTKALTWRVISTLTTVIIVYIVTGELSIAAMIGGIEFVVKFVIYYGHERVWNLIQ